MEKHNQEKGANNSKKEINSQNSFNILNKIKHKPVILDHLFSFSGNRPFILLYFISKDKTLKQGMKKMFDGLKMNNDLSKQLNRNIISYKNYRILFEKLDNIIIEYNKNYIEKEKEINNILKKPLGKERFFENQEVIDYIKNKKFNLNQKISNKILNYKKKIQ